MGSKSGEKPRRRRGRKNGEHGAGSTGQSTLSNGPRSRLIHFTEDAPTWYECGKQTPGRDATIFSDPPPPSDLKNNKTLIEKYRSQADDLIRADVQLFNQQSSEGSPDVDERWLENTMRRGTLKDRIAAMSVVVSTNPVHKLHALDGLLQMAGCSESGGQTNARMAQLAAEALEDLFLNTLLPRHRKLVPLAQRPLYLYEQHMGKKGARLNTLSPRILLLWRYEELIQEKYQSFLRQYLSMALRDGVEMSKLHALRSAGMLLRSAPEAEEQLLSMMVNKLGDPAKKTAAAAGHELRRVLERHGNMQAVIAREVQQLAYRPHLSARALYNCIIFLNQLKLENEVEPEKGNGSEKKKGSRHVSLPVSLVQTYFRLFEVAVNKTTNETPNNSPAMKGRLLSALLTGVNRAHPYLPEADKDLDTHIDSLYRVVHIAPPAASTQALMLLFLVSAAPSENGTARKLSNSSKAKQDRFYRALYATLSQSSMVSSGKHLTMYFNLLYKAMKHDSDECRVQVLAKRLLCSTLHSSASIIAASLFLLNEIMKSHPQLRICFEEVVEGLEASAMLDPTKREPAGALVSAANVGSTRKVVDYAPLWETSLVAHHFHPSVAKFSATLSEISYAGDPLVDFSLTPFLDKFAYRNPKASTRSQGNESVAARRTTSTSQQNGLPVNDPSFLRREHISERDEFFRNFFVERARRVKLKNIDKVGASADVEESSVIDTAANVDFDQHFENGWDTDSEEEAFVDELAAKLMDDQFEDQADLDEEDPEMEGWDDSEEEPEDKLEKTGANNVESPSKHYGNDSNFEASDSIFESGMYPSNDVDAFMEESDAADSSNEELGGVVESDGENDLALVGESDQESEGALQSTLSIPDVTFADASEYEELITREWNSRKYGMDASFAEPSESSPPETVRRKRKRKK